MKALQYIGSFDEATLREQFVIAFPAWRIVSGTFITEYYGSQYDTSTGVLTIWVPDDADEGLIQQVIDAHDPSAVPWTPLNWQSVIDTRKAFLNLPNWATWTAEQASEYIRQEILAGMTRTEIEAWVNANVTTLATAKTALILVGQELIDLRVICSSLAKAVIYLRDLAVRR
jgi:hypothetical protein